MNERAAPTAPAVVCIVGMHRSGTSCLTGSLQQAGLHLGKFSSWNRYNEKGNRENQDIVDFHEELLAANGASWDAPPRRLRYSREQLQRARELVNSYRSEQPWGFKDPRSLLALELWREAARPLQLVGIFRHPRAVAESISRRSGGRISIEQAVGLWQHYNRILYKAWRRERFPMLCFDWDEQRFGQRLEELVRHLGLEGGGQPDFYASELMHHDTGNWEGIPWRVKRLYSRLAAAAEHAL